MNVSSTSKLGVRSFRFDHHVNDKGLLHVPFRYSRESMTRFRAGLQIQYETIVPGAERGHHYHTVENGDEEFCVLGGMAALIVQETDSQYLECIRMASFCTYLVPAGLAHVVVNLSKFGSPPDPVTLLISKHFDYSVELGTKPYQIDYSCLMPTLKDFVLGE